MAIEGLSWRCCRCDGVHHGLPDYGFSRPLPWDEATSAERSAGKLTSEICELGEHRFVRTVLHLPIVGSEESFGYGVWVSLSREHYDRFVELEGADQRECDGPWFGWLCNRLPDFRDTYLLKTHIHLQPNGWRPLVELEPTSHPLAIHQRIGLRLSHAIELAERMLHPAEEKLHAYPYVACCEHGEAHGAFVCGHIADGDHEGWFAAEDPTDPWPNAWCEACEQTRMREGGWNDVSEAAARIKIVCAGCYVARRDGVEG